MNENETNERQQQIDGYCFNTQTGQWTTRTINSKINDTDQFGDNLNYTYSGSVVFDNSLFICYNRDDFVQINKERIQQQSFDISDVRHVLMRSRPIFTSASRVERILTAIHSQTSNDDRDKVKVKIFSSADGVNYSLAERLTLESGHIESIAGRLGASAMYYIIQIEGNVNSLVVTGVFLQEKTKLPLTQEVNMQ